MPPKKDPETPEEQSERFRREAQRLISAGELDPVAGEAVLDKLVRKPVPHQP